MCRNKHPDSNLIPLNDLQFQKHLEPIISTFIGIQICANDDSEKDSGSSRFNKHSESNVTTANNKQFEKHFDPRISTLFGMQISFK
jgi:hypothetical protein